MIWIIIAAAAVLLFFFRKGIGRYFEGERKHNYRLDCTDPEIEKYVAKYSVFSSDELARLSNSENKRDKELLAIRKVLMQRHTFPKL